MESFSLLYGDDACKQAKLFFLVWNVGTVGVCNYSVFSLQRWHSTYSHFQNSLLLLLNISCLQQHHHHFMYEWVAFGNFFLSSSSSSYYVYDGKDMIIEQSKKEKKSQNSFLILFIINVSSFLFFWLEKMSKKRKMANFFTMCHMPTHKMMLAIWNQSNNDNDLIFFLCVCQSIWNFCFLLEKIEKNIKNEMC